jgi:hypothetical protein
MDKDVKRWSIPLIESFFVIVVSNTGIEMIASPRAIASLHHNCWRIII